MTRAMPVDEDHIVFVDAVNREGPWDGRSWATAFVVLHDGLDAAEAMVAGAGARPQVWVARGIYRPSAGVDREAAFRLRRGVDLVGGFHGDETAPEQRDWKTNETELSGAIGARREAGSLHVVIGADDAVLDGFTVCDGFNLPGGPPPHHMCPPPCSPRTVKAWGPASCASAVRPPSATASSVTTWPPRARACTTSRRANGRRTRPGRRRASWTARSSVTTLGHAAARSATTS